MLPFSLVNPLDLAAPVASAVLAYAFFGLDALDDELEAPFSTAANAVPLDAMVRGIETAVLEAAGADDLPAPLQPCDFLLL